MTEPTRAAVVDCLHCRNPFEPRKDGHVFCSIACRHRGERLPGERISVDRAAVERLFDPSRDPTERAREDDWFPDSCAAMKHLYMVDTVQARRRWYLNLLESGRL